MKFEDRINIMDINETESTDANGNSRRRFLQKAAAGAVLASIPAKSVWAEGLNSGSILASATASATVLQQRVALRSPGFWLNHDTKVAGIDKEDTFYSVFGGIPLGIDEADLPPGYTHETLTLQIILDNPGNGNPDTNGNGNGQHNRPDKGQPENFGLGGSGNINCYLVTMYLNAAHHNWYDIYYPIVGYQHISAAAFATFLYGRAIFDEWQVAETLHDVIVTNHV
jgi:hypothetical protein